MKQYYIDLRPCEESERDRIWKIINALAWDIYIIPDVPNAYAFMWDRKEPVNEIPDIPKGLISVFVE